MLNIARLFHSDWALNKMIYIYSILLTLDLLSDAGVIRNTLLYSYTMKNNSPLSTCNRQTKVCHFELVRICWCCCSRGRTITLKLIRFHTRLSKRYNSFNINKLNEITMVKYKVFSSSSSSFLKQYGLYVYQSSFSFFILLHVFNIGQVIIFIWFYCSAIIPCAHNLSTNISFITCCTRFILYFYHSYMFFSYFLHLVMSLLEHHG